MGLAALFVKSGKLGEGGLLSESLDLAISRCLSDCLSPCHFSQCPFQCPSHCLSHCLYHCLSHYFSRCLSHCLTLYLAGESASLFHGLSVDPAANVSISPVVKFLGSCTAAVADGSIPAQVCSLASFDIRVSMSLLLALVLVLVASLSFSVAC